MKKDIFIVILIIICVALSIVMIGLFEKSRKVNKSLEEEKYSRMIAEESLQKNASKLIVLETQLRKANDKMAKVQDLIDAEKSVNGDLQRQYEELNKIKMDLESKLKSMVVNNSASSAQSGEVANSLPIAVSQ